jgi:ankyrin repeat protein
MADADIHRIEALEQACFDGVRYLLQAGADREFTCYGFRPIHHAIDIEIDTASQANSPEDPEPILTELLLSAGADMNAENDRGQTPLRMAMQRGHRRAAELLRSRGAVA